MTADISPGFFRIRTIIEEGKKYKVIEAFYRGEGWVIKEVLDEIS